MDAPIVRAALDALLRRDLGALLALLHPEVEIRSLLTEAERPLYHGHDGARDWFEAVFGVFPDWRPDPRAPRDEGGGAVLVPLDVTATAAASGVPIDQSYWLGALVEADKILFLGFFRTEDDAREAVEARQR